MQGRMLRLEEKWRKTEKAAGHQNQGKRHEQRLVASKMRAAVRRLQGRRDRRRVDGMTQEKHELKPDGRDQESSKHSEGSRNPPPRYEKWFLKKGMLDRESSLPSLTVLIPCLNEALGIAEVVREYAAAFPQATILVVDNGSDDGTAAVARSAGAEVITERRRGKATAVATAFARDRQRTGPDGGRRWQLSGGWRPSARRTVSARTGRYDHRHSERAKSDPGFPAAAPVGHVDFRRRPQLRFFASSRSIFSPGMRLFSRRFYKHVPVLSRGFELEIELTIQAVDKGFAQTEIPVPFRSRAKGSASKLKTTRDGLRIFRLLVVLFRDYRPLTFFGHIAGIAALLGLSAGCIPIAEYFRIGLVNRLPLAVLAASLVTLSIIIGLVGLLLEANLRYHREAYHVQLRKYGAPTGSQRASGKFRA